MEFLSRVKKTFDVHKQVAHFLFVYLKRNRTQPAVIYSQCTILAHVQLFLTSWNFRLTPLFVLYDRASTQVPHQTEPQQLEVDFGASEERETGHPMGY